VVVVVRSLGASVSYAKRNQQDENRSDSFHVTPWEVGSVRASPVREAGLDGPNLEVNVP
jgi:hypothetical protein